MPDSPARRRVALATCAAIPRLTDDDRLLPPALAALGVTGEAAVWDDPGVRWDAYDAVVIRSCWDYHLRPADFLAWIDRLAHAGVRLCNPPAVLRWNASKRYLRPLADAGVAVTPTRWLDAGSDATLGATLDAAGWDDVVVKPVISATAHETWRASRRTLADDEPRFRALLARTDVMVQPFVRAVTTAGEWSLLFFGGRFSHAVLKRPRAGDFRVQREFGGGHVAATPDAALVREAARALALAPAPCTYARVDGCAVDGRLQIMELELLEPALYLADAPGAPGAMAAAVLAAID